MLNSLLEYEALIAKLNAELEVMRQQNVYFRDLSENLQQKELELGTHFQEEDGLSLHVHRVGSLLHRTCLAPQFEFHGTNGGYQILVLLPTVPDLDL